MVACGLAAVEPDRGVAIDCVFEQGARRRRRGGDEPAAEPSRQRLAWIVERGLHHGVVLGVKDKIHDRPLGLVDVVGLKGKLSVLADIDGRPPHTAHWGIWR